MNNFKFCLEGFFLREKWIIKEIIIIFFLYCIGLFKVFLELIIIIIYEILFVIKLR